MPDATEKKYFLHNLESEVVFLKEVLVPLFENMKKFKVVFNHGSTERGADIVLIGVDEFGKNTYTAIVAKNEDITNAASSRHKEIVATVSTQITMCINSGYECLEQKKLVFYNKILVVTSHTISGSARPEFLKVAASHRFPSVDFMQDMDLIRLLDEYLPEVYSVKRGGLSKYFHSLMEICEKLNEHKNIAIYKGEARKILDIFVEPTLNKKQEVIENGVLTEKSQATRLAELIKKNQNILIYGAAGAGKSTLVRSEVMNLLHSYEADKKSKIPILIKLKEYLSETLAQKKLKPEERLKNYLSIKYSLSISDADTLLASEQALIFFLDGHDELNTQDERTLFVELINLIKGRKDFQYVIATRKKGGFLDKEFSECECWTLSQFNTKQIKQFLDKWLTTKNDHLLSALQDHGILEKLPRTPLVITLIAILFENDNSVELPSNLSELYRMFIELLLGRWNLERRIGTFYQANDKELFLTAIAMYLHENRLTSCSETEIIGIFLKANKKLGKDIEPRSMLDDVILNTNLIVKSEEDRYEFRHLSFQEYFVATEYFRNGRAGAKLVHRFPDEWWNQVLYFFFGLRKDNGELLPAIYKKIKPLEGSDKIKALWYLGYLIQSSYTTHADVRTELIKKIFNDYSAAVYNYAGELKRRKQKTPRILFFMSMVYLLKMHYGSRHLKRILETAHDQILKKVMGGAVDFDSAFSLFLASILLAELGDLEFLLIAEPHFKNHPELRMLEDFELRYGLNKQIKDSPNKKELQRHANNVLKSIRSNIPFYKKYIE